MNKAMRFGIQNFEKIFDADRAKQSKVKGCDFNESNIKGRYKRGRKKR